ncbi:isoprenylcysteine carboxylmethyltransferase family protein, partial [Rhizobium phaseoli]
MKINATGGSFLDIYLVLDIIEKVLVVYLFVAIVLRILPQAHGDRAIIDCLLLVSEGAAAFLI